MSDTISRQAAIDVLDNLRVKSADAEKGLLLLSGIAAAMDEIEHLPSAEPRKGKWIGYKADDKDWQRDDGSPVFMNCSECHEAVINNGSAHWNFCPNCGADMRG